MIQFLVVIVLAYLIGSVPTSYIAGRITKGIDIRKYGSGNVGATNTLRVFGKKMGAIVLLADMAKGAFCVLVLPAIFYTEQLQMSLPLFKAYIGGFAVFGHIWTIFLGFKGGKGVATTCGVFLGLSPIPALLAIAIWIAVLILTKYVSVSSLLMMLSLPFLLFLFKQPHSYIFLCILLLTIIIYTHRENVKRLVAGQENRIGRKMREKG